MTGRFMLGCALLGVVGTTLPAEAAETTFELRERLGKNWRRQAVSFPLRAAEGQCHAKSLRLIGPEGPVACQLSDVEYWPGKTHVKSGKVWFVSGLSKLETKTFRLQYGSKPAEGKAPAADLKATRNDASLKLATSRFGVRLMLGGRKYARGSKPSKVPGPIIALRLADGTWFGASKLYGKAKVMRYAARLVAEGPVFGEVAYTYEYSDGNRLDLTVRLSAADDRVLFDADVQKDSPSDGLGIAISPKLPPLTLVVQYLWWSQRKIYPGKAQIGDWFEQRLDSYPPGLVMNLSPWGPWWDDFTAPVVRIKIGDTGRELHIARRDPGAWVAPAPMGTFKTSAGLEHKYLPIRKSKGGVVFVDLNLAAGEAGGVRRFTIGESLPTEEVGWHHRRDSLGTTDVKGARIGSTVIPYHEPLDVVKDYVLDWPKKVRHPLVFMSADDLAKARQSPLTGKRHVGAWLALKPAHISREDWLKGPLSKPVRAFYGGYARISAQPHASDAHRLAPYLLTGSKEVARILPVAGTLKHHLGLLGDFDKMLKTHLVVGLYDAVIDTDLVTDRERKLLRAQMAYLGYRLAHPSVWSTERGFNSGNLNMTVAYRLSLGTVACAVPDHPMAATWVKPSLVMMDSMLEKIGPGGEWPESIGYAHGSASHLMGFAVSATRAGFKDYVNDPRLKSLMLWLAKCYTPPDPREPQGVGGVRRTIMFGRAGGGETSALIGVMARATRDSDPDYAGALQWVWKGMGAPVTRLGDWRLGGFEYVYVDPTQPAKVPDWTADRFPKMGVIMRNGLGTDTANYVAVLSGDHTHMIYGSQTGAVASFFGLGKPLGGSFWGAYQDQEEFLTCRVSLARAPGTVEDRNKRSGYLGGQSNAGFFFQDRKPARFGQHTGAGNVSAFSSLPRQDYAAVDVALERPQDMGHWKVHQDLPWPPLSVGEGKPPVLWRRQVLFIKDERSDGANYLLLRDTVQGKSNPGGTMWTFWTSSQKVGTPEQVANLKAFLADAPGDRIVPPRPLEGNRFTAVGGFGVDLEYYVAAPTGTPRYTLRWGTSYKYHPLYLYKEYQDLLHLQLPGDGHYYVALFPRRRKDAAPTFSTLADGTVIKVAGTFGTDWGFLSALPAKAEAGDVGFQGVAGSVQVRAGRTVLNLGAEGHVRYRSVGLTSDVAAAVGWKDPSRITVQLPRGHVAARLQLKIAGIYGCDDKRVQANATDGGVELTVPPEVTQLRLLRR